MEGILVFASPLLNFQQSRADKDSHSLTKVKLLLIPDPMFQVMYRLWLVLTHGHRYLPLSTGANRAVVIIVKVWDKGNGLSHLSDPEHVLPL